jgi:hypothetical protein
MSVCFSVLALVVLNACHITLGFMLVSGPKIGATQLCLKTSVPVC